MHETISPGRCRLFFLPAIRLPTMTVTFDIATRDFIGRWLITFALFSDIRSSPSYLLIQFNVLSVLSIILAFRLIVKHGAVWRLRKGRKGDRINAKSPSSPSGSSSQKNARMI
ncbi:MAG: hypothetical protein ACD_56C00135G0001 [uncultured bacterium]|nr:MAG: hypothetical protein ACD_56C00135G0001 [uncultured bacterium]